MLPAVIIHLLDIKSSSPVTRELSLQGFGLCMQVMQGLRENYAAADFATHFLEAAVKKANIQIPAPNRQRFATADEAMKAVNHQRHQMYLLHQHQAMAQRVRSTTIDIGLGFTMTMTEDPNMAPTPPPELVGEYEG